MAVAHSFSNLSNCGCVSHAQVAKTLNERITRYCQVTLESCAYAGMGDVLQIQHLLSLCGEHFEPEEGEEWQVRHFRPFLISR